MIMGAEFNYVTFADKLGKDAIIRQWDSLCEQSRYDSGHSYSGAIGMLDGSPDWRDTMFASRHEAYEYVSDTQEKWEPPLAASFIKDGDKFWLIGGWCSS